MRRRQLAKRTAGVLTLPLVALSGCLSRRQRTLRVQPVDDLAGRIATTSDELDPRQRIAVRVAVRDGDHRTSGYHPFRDGQSVEWEGEFFRITITSGGEVERTRPVLIAEFVNAERDTVPIEAYDGIDRMAVFFAIASAHGGELELPREDVQSTDGFPLRDFPEAESDLLPEPNHEYVEANDDSVRLEGMERDLLETEYTTTASRVASDATEFEAYAVETGLVADLDDEALPADHREILDTAISDGTYSGDAEEIDPLVERLGPGFTYGTIREGGEYYTWYYHPAIADDATDEPVVE